MIKVQSEGFDPGDTLNEFMRGRTDKGAVVSFTGHVRDFAGDDSVSILELEHYPGYTETEIARIEATALEKWPGIETLIIHRYGPMVPGEPIVFVGVCSAHRHDAFEAASYLMDYLKTNAPFWKKEIRGETEIWIEPKETDYAAQKAWDK